MRTAVLLVSMKLATALSPCSTVMKRTRAWFCMSVVKALIAANNVHEEEVSSHQVGSHRMVFGGPGATHGGIGSTMEGTE